MPINEFNIGEVVVIRDWILDDSVKGIEKAIIVGKPATDWVKVQDQKGDFHIKPYWYFEHEGEFGELPPSVINKLHAKLESIFVGYNLLTVNNNDVYMVFDRNTNILILTIDENYLQDFLEYPSI